MPCDGLAAQERSALTVGLEYVFSLAFMRAGRILDDPNMMESGASDQLRFADDYIPRFGRRKSQHRRLGSRARKASKTLKPFDMREMVGDA